MVAWICAAVLGMWLALADVRAQETNDKDEEGAAPRPKPLVERFLEAPSIAVYYGTGRLGREGVTQDFHPVGALTLHLGSADLEPLRRYKDLAEYQRNYLHLGFGAATLGIGGKTGALASQWWRFGVGQETGYGYPFGAAGAVLLTHGGGLQWAILRFRDAISEGLVPYHDRLRFGTLRDGAIWVQFTPLLGLGVSFERGVIFLAHLFWKHLGSLVLEGAGHALVDEFVRRVLRARTPEAAPIVAFLLHNGLAIGWYELLRQRMHWPFATPSPLWNDAVRFHVQWLF
ncbi:MAG: hypothetical protein NZ960_06725 [Candidatus Kapabacteria bacterium]|nr:hypothetical protein [Candidatus Kapabacteria bacterium]MDW8012737.1 hypothetical protein [Bacteroidota bacterium]